MRRKTVIAKNVYLYSTKVTTPCVSISYEIECACFQCLQFELSFDGSVNFTLDVSDSSASLISPLRLSHIVPPYKRVFLGTIRVNAPSQRAVLCLEYNWTFEDLSINDWLADSGANKKYIEVLLSPLLCFYCIVERASESQRASTPPFYISCGYRHSLHEPPSLVH